MGLFTWVEHGCECGKRVEWQSKAHPFEEYGRLDINHVEVKVAKDIAGDVQTCECGKHYRIEIAPRDVEFVPMIVEEL